MRSTLLPLMTAAFFLGRPVMGLAEMPILDLPIDCALGQDCFIQQYVDLDPGPGVEDYHCGAVSYDGHKGTDFRIITIRDVLKKIAVIASAPGRVSGVRDGMIDQLVKRGGDDQRLAGRECGNGVVLDHGHGWQTQYCHLRQGSVAVEIGDVVEAGHKLGEVGYSGQAQFPHVHLSLRQGGRVIDPFKGPGLEDQQSCGLGPRHLWRKELLPQLAYRPTQILRFGIAEGPIEQSYVETGLGAEVTPVPSSPALVGWLWAINLKDHDELVIRLHGPQGEISRQVTKIEDRKAQWVMFSGKRRPATGWAAGHYSAHFSIRRRDDILHTRMKRFKIED